MCLWRFEMCIRDRYWCLSEHPPDPPVAESRQVHFLFWYKELNPPQQINRKMCIRDSIYTMDFSKYLFYFPAMILCYLIKMCIRDRTGTGNPGISGIPSAIPGTGTGRSYHRRSNTWKSTHRTGCRRDLPGRNRKSRNLQRPGTILCRNYQRCV